MTQYTDHTPPDPTTAERDRAALAGEAAQLPQHLGGALGAMKTLLSRDPCAHHTPQLR
jgi:hypothetical protein